MPRRNLKSTDLRPTQGIVQKSLLDILRPRLAEASFLDLFAGTGKIGFLALEGGARKAVLVENAPRQIKLLQETAAKADWGEKAQIVPLRVESALERLKGPFDLIFIDPPYSLSQGIPTLSAILRRGLLAPGGWAVVEHHLKDRLPETLETLVKFRSKIFGQTVLSFYREDSGEAIGNQGKNNLEDNL